MLPPLNIARLAGRDYEGLRPDYPAQAADHRQAGRRQQADHAHQATRPCRSDVGRLAAASSPEALDPPSSSCRMGTLGLVLPAGLRPFSLCLPGARPHLGVRLRLLIGHAGQSSLSACSPMVAPVRIVSFAPGRKTADLATRCRELYARGTADGRKEAPP